MEQPGSEEFSPITKQPCIMISAIQLTGNTMHFPNTGLIILCILEHQSLGKLETQWFSPQQVLQQEENY